MNKEQFSQLTASGYIYLDGATGTHLQASGMPTGICPENWILDNPTVLQDLQQKYYEAGSQIVYAFTFGANRVKLAHHRLDPEKTEEINRRLASLSIEIRNRFNKNNPDRKVFVAGDLAPTGSFLFPAGDLNLNQLIDIYREQVRGQLQAGVDLFIAETMMDLAEARAAVLAVQAECDLPVMVSMTFEESGRTLSGNSPMEALITLASLGVSAFGINCSFGPEKMGQLIEPLINISPVPLLLKPNAGLPVLVDGKTVFPMGPQSFAAAMNPLAVKGIRIFGGCCGTSPAHLKELTTSLGTAGILSANEASDKSMAFSNLICSSRKTWQVEDPSDLPLVECNDPDSLIDDVYEVIDDDPPAICLDLDAAAADENSFVPLLEALQQVQVMIQIPFVFRSENPALIDQLLLIYNGRAGLMTSQSVKNRGALRL